MRTTWWLPLSPSNDSENVRKAFENYYSEASDRFFYVDKSVLELCERLTVIRNDLELMDQIMDDTNSPVIADAARSFPSFIALRAKHSELLQREPDD